MTTKTATSFGLYKHVNGYDGLKEKVVDGLSACIEFTVIGDIDECNEEMLSSYLKSAVAVTFGAGYGEYVLLPFNEFPENNKTFQAKVNIDIKDIVSTTLAKIRRKSHGCS